MNYLAHLYCSPNSPESLIGNLMGDFVKGKIDGRYTPEIRQGIELHRKVDVFTDSHPVFRASKQLVSLPRRRFAGIMVDVFYDHFLARHWLEYSSVPLTVFSQQVYRILTDHSHLLPDRLLRALPYMVSQDWLSSYADLSSIRLTINRISSRFRRVNSMLEGAEELKAHYQHFESHFRSFFPDLTQFANEQQRKNQ